MLTSIVIPVHNNLEMTEACMESIEAYTPEEHEVIVVDNGSTDGTPEYILRRKGIKVIRNEENLGFARAVNAGIRASSGNYVVVLNNDVLVTPGWLSNLLYCVESDPVVGAVGPVTGNCSGVQKIPVGFQTPEEMFRFAERWNRPDPEKWFETARLVAFCLLVKREVFERVGLFDERFGQGNFEDDDFCLRARLAGYKLLVAGDTYVHHIGSATFAKSKVDYGMLMGVNQGKFAHKWASRLSGFFASYRQKCAREDFWRVDPSEVPVSELVAVGHVPPGLENMVDAVADTPQEGKWALRVRPGEAIEGLLNLRAALDGPRVTRLLTVVYRTPFGEMVSFSPRLEYPGTKGEFVLPGVTVRSFESPARSAVETAEWAADLERGVSWAFAGKVERVQEAFASALVSGSDVARLAAAHNLKMLGGLPE